MKKLSLSRETVQRLDEGQMEVQAGIAIDPLPPTFLPTRCITFRVTGCCVPTRVQRTMCYCTLPM